MGHLKRLFVSDVSIASIEISVGTYLDAETDLTKISETISQQSKRGLQMKNGTKKTISPGESYSIPPGHDAWVEGNERFVAIEVMSAENYAKS